MATAQLKPIAKDFYLDTALATLIRIISADRIGWRKHGNAADLATIYSFIPAHQRAKMMRVAATNG